MGAPVSIRRSRRHAPIAVQEISEQSGNICCKIMDVLEQTVLAPTCAPRDGDSSHRRSIRRDSMRAIISMAALCVVIASPAEAIRPDE
jgi:hypothetical protein